MSIFLPNKYTNWYFSIITSAQTSNDLYTGYTEKHHVIPKSMGGSNEPENLIRLTARQHFVCHLLLTKMVDGTYYKRKALRGLRAMALMDHNGGRKGLRVTSRVFAVLREVNRLPDSPETKERKRLAGLRRPLHREDTKKKMRDSWAKRNGVAKKYLPRPLRWKAVSPTGEVFEFESLKDFCLEKALHKPSISYAAKMGKPLPPMQRKLRKTTDVRRNTVGWFLEKQR